MDIEQLWEMAQQKTEIVRGRIKGLSTFENTAVPYIFLAETTANERRTIVRKGKVLIERPLILLPEDLPQFEGFDFEETLDLEQGAVQMFFLMRGVRFPSLKYNNIVGKLEVEAARPSKTVEKYKKNLEKKENVNTALLIGPNECWQFSILLYMASLVGRCVRSDITNLINKFRREAGQ